MLFKPEQKEHIAGQWGQVAASRQACGNAWHDDWQTAYAGLEAAFARADGEDTPEAWANLSLQGRQLRELMAQSDGEETFLYLKLVKLTDGIEAALDEIATPSNLVPRGELRELQKRLDQQIELAEEERRQTSVFQREIRKQLDAALEEFKSGKRTIVKIEEFSVVSLNVDELVSAIKDGIIAIKNGVEMLNDPRFTEQLRRGALRLLRSTKRFYRATKERFGAFRLPWQKSAADEALERANPTFGLPPEPEDGPFPRGLRILVRDGAGDREEWRVPGAGEPFRDSWVDERGRSILGPEMVVVPAGEFLMGSPDNEAERSDSEGPQHKVIIPRPFATGRFALTFDEWDAAVADREWQRITGVAPYQPDDNGWERGNRPVINVSWMDAQSYIKWLTAKSGKEYRR